MYKMLLNILLAAAIFLTLLNTGTASAACSVSATPVSFGSYDTFSPSPTDTTGSVIVTCDEQQPPRVIAAISQSASSGTFSPRWMHLATGSDVLEYNIYTNKQYTKIWGDSSGNTYTESSAVKENKPWVSTLYARIPAGQDVSAGSYNDTLTVTITW